MLYGATAGKLFAAGQAGERFAVRNSGALVVVEGCGSNGCEYMTGGTAVILGKVGENFGAGMTGGMAFIYDEDGSFARKVNEESVIFQRIEVPHYEALLKSLIAGACRGNPEQVRRAPAQRLASGPRPLLAGRAEGDGPPARHSGPRGTGGGLIIADLEMRGDATTLDQTRLITWLFRTLSHQRLLVPDDGVR